MKTLIRSALCAVSLTAFAAASSAAQETPLPSAEAIAKVESCLATSDADYTDPFDCTGLLYEACAGERASTYEMVECMDQEAAYWTEHQALLFTDLTEAYEAKARKSISGEAVSESLARAQTVWSAYRDAQCRFEYDLEGDGSRRNTSSAACKLDMAAERALYLRSLKANLPPS